MMWLREEHSLATFNTFLNKKGLPTKIEPSRADCEMTEMIGRHLENEKCIWVDSSQLAVACEITFQAEGEFCRYRAGPHPLFVAVCVGYFCKTESTSL